MNRSVIRASSLCAFLLPVLLAAGAARAADGPPRTAATGWALLEVSRPAGSDDATWCRAVMTETEKLRQIVVTDGSPLLKTLQAIAPGSLPSDINERLPRMLEVREIPGTALIQVRLNFNDDPAKSAKATGAIIDEHLRLNAAAPEARRTGIHVITLPVGR